MRLRVDPIPRLLGSADQALVYFARRDLLGEPVGDVEQLWQLPVPAGIVRRQQPDGSWRYGGRAPSYANYNLLETFRNLTFLTRQYGFDRRHPAIEAAAEYVFSCQTEEGDIRGILGNQYMPYYHGATLELLIAAGYQDDERVVRGLDWLLSVRQDDGCWIIPAQALPAREKTETLWRGAPVAPERSRPFSHLATGMVLRAFAAHRVYRERDEVRLAARRFKERFLKADKYNDRKSPAYWTKFQYPYWWTDLSSGLETVARIGIGPEDEDVRRAVAWFVSSQERDGLWPTAYDKGKDAGRMREWVGLAICWALAALPE